MSAARTMFTHKGMTMSAMRWLRKLRDGKPAVAIDLCEPDRQESPGIGPTSSADTEPAAHETAPRRLERLAAWCVTGRLAGAELELHEWSRSNDCPAAARIMLAALMARRKRMADAIAILEAAEHHDAALTPGVAQLLIALSLSAAVPQRAQKWLQYLAENCIDADGVTEWLHAMAWPGVRIEQPQQSAVEQLVDQLLAQPDQLVPLVSSLVQTQQIQSDPSAIALLRDAVARIVEQITDRRRAVALHVALAELSLLAGDAQAVRTWAHRGLKVDPYSATLALMLAKVKDDPALGPPARDVLARVVKAHPRYPDVEAALIRRQAADGDAEQARHRLTRWLQRDPHAPLAHHLQKELAA